jgi:hypothetical protein
VAWQKPFYPFKECFLSGGVTVGQIIRKRLEPEFWFYIPGGQYGFDLRAPNEISIFEVVVKGLNSQSVPGKDQPLMSFVIDGESKHPPQKIYNVQAIFLIKVNYSFCVASAFVFVPLGLQLQNIVFVIIKFAIVNNPNCLIFIGHWLMPVLEVDDAQAAVTQANVVLYEHSGVVRSPMDEAIAHGLNALVFYRSFEISAYDSTYSAHD